MVEIGDIGKRILRDYQVDINNFCPSEFYQRVLEEVDEMRSRLVRKLIENIPDALKIRT